MRSKREPTILRFERPRHTNKNFPPLPQLPRLKQAIEDALRERALLKAGIRTQ